MDDERVRSFFDFMCVPVFCCLDPLGFMLSIIYVCVYFKCSIDFCRYLTIPPQYYLCKNISSSMQFYRTNYQDSM